LIWVFDAAERERGQAHARAHHCLTELLLECIAGGTGGEPFCEDGRKAVVLALTKPERFLATAPGE